MADLAPALPALRPARALPAALGWRLVWLAIVAAALWQQARLGLDSDVSWLLTAGEKLLGGARLYVDVLETNPPASVLLYLPGILLGRLLGVSSEAATVTCVTLLALGSAEVGARTLVRGGLLPPAALGPARAGAAAILLLVPAACFAQREHVAVIALLPLLAVAAVRAAGRPVPLATALLAGAGAGVVIAIKPHFALAVLPVAIWTAGRARAWRVLTGAEAGAAAAVVGGYAVLVATAFRPFVTDWLPVLRLAYLPMRDTAWHLLEQAALLVGACAAAVACRFAGRDAAARWPVVPPLLAATGFAAAAAIQGKGYLNHYYPVAAFALLALLGTLAEVRRPDDRRLAAAALVVLLLAGVRCFSALAGLPGLEEAARRVAPPHPRVMLAGAIPDVGHPLVRRLDGRWVQRPPSLWLTEAVAEQLAPGAPALPAATRVQLQALARADAAMFVADLQRGQPDLVLVDGDAFAAWIAGQPAVARALAGYREAARAGDVRLWVRWKS